MQPGTKEQAIALAKARWAARWPFDLDAAIWENLFGRFRFGEILEGIKKTAHTRNPAPDAAYRSLLYFIQRCDDDRRQRHPVDWPPPDVTPN